MMISQFNRVLGACLIAATVAVTSFAATPSGSLDSWIQGQALRARNGMLANVSAPGAARGSVVASPSRDNPDYFFHWVRDSGLVMETIAHLYAKATDAAERQLYSNLLFDYADFSRGNQLTPNRSGGLGEPKFNADGSAFTGDWGRPQNDGPAIRANALISFANRLLDEGQEATVRSRLYDSSLPANTVIKADLEYVAAHWGDTSYEPWEEVRGHHFYTKMVMRRALLQGASLADRLHDGGAASFYRGQAAQLEHSILDHWDAHRGYFVVTLQRDGGLDYKDSGLDSQVILAVLHGGNGDGFLTASSDQILATAEKIRESFDVLFPVNKNTALGTAIGRYPEDRYDGGTGNQGNPWFLTTLAFAELSYDAAREFQSRGWVDFNALNNDFFNHLRCGNRVVAKVGTRIPAGDPRFDQLMSCLRQTGDAYVARVRMHLGADGSMPEQFNRNTGFGQSARDLTWSYASFLTMSWSR